LSSFMSTSLGAFSAAAQDLTGIGSTIREANAAAAGSTTSVVAAAQDEVSEAISALFGSYGREYQALTAQTALFHDQFVQALTSGGNAYNNTEAASTTVLDTYDSITGADLVAMQRLERESLALPTELLRTVAVGSEAEREQQAALTLAFDTWAQTAERRTQMLKTVSDVLRQIG